MNKFTFYKVLDPYDTEDIKAGNLKICLCNSRRRSDLKKPSEEQLAEFERCKQLIKERNQFLRNIQQPLIDEKFCKTDVETYSFENMMQLLRKIYSGYLYYENSDLAITPSNINIVEIYDMFEKEGNLIGIVENSFIEEA